MGYSYRIVGMAGYQATETPETSLQVFSTFVFVDIIKCIQSSCHYLQDQSLSSFSFHRDLVAGSHMEASMKVRGILPNEANKSENTMLIRAWWGGGGTGV